MDTDPDTAGRPTDLESGALISEMRGRIEDLWEQLQAERQAYAEARQLLAAALKRIPPQLEAPESPESPGPPTPTDAGEGPQEPSSRPCWRRWFQSR
jgi:hypothetical protein